MKVLVSAVGWAGHALPALGLAAELRARGHEVIVDTAERWRGQVEADGIGFSAAEERIRFGGAVDAAAPTMAEVVRNRAAGLAELEPDLAVCDLFTLAPALAAELAGVRRATLVPHPYPLPGTGMPPFPLGLLPARTPVGRLAWKAVAGTVGTRLPSLDLRSVRAQLNAVRRELGLAPQERLIGQISAEMVLVATFPQLEYPRRWPRHVHVTGPVVRDLPCPPVDPPPGDAPLVVVAGSTEQDPGLALVRTALEALAGEPVRVVAVLNRDDASWPGPVPANAEVATWADYGPLMRAARLAITTGGHGTVARALVDGAPVLVCPAGGDTAATGARVAWSGAGLSLPRRLLAPGTLRVAVRRLVAGAGYTARASELASWAAANPGAAGAAERLERRFGEAT